VTCASIFNQENRKFEFRPGPLFGQIILADEINRATPKTQAACSKPWKNARSW
jgi:MoxR-like ATPase